MRETMDWQKVRTPSPDAWGWGNRTRPARKPIAWMTLLALISASSPERKNREQAVMISYIWEKRI